MILKRTHLLFIFMLLATSCAAESTKIMALVPCKDIKFDSEIIQVVQKVSGKSEMKTIIPLEDHYYPQMSRPNSITLTSKQAIKSVSLLGSDRTSFELKNLSKKKEQYQFSLPDFKSLKGKFIVNFENGEVCKREIQFEELSP